MQPYKACPSSAGNEDAATQNHKLSQAKIHIQALQATQIKKAFCIGYCF
jgi:hypothetical protein